MTILSIHLRFHEPFRLAPWFPKGQRNKNNYRWQRVQTYAQLHKENDCRGRPFITGTQLRSALIQAVEEELVFSLEGSGKVLNAVQENSPLTAPIDHNSNANGPL